MVAMHKGMQPSKTVKNTASKHDERNTLNLTLLDLKDTDNRELSVNMFVFKKIP